MLRFDDESRGGSGGLPDARCGGAAAQHPQLAGAATGGAGARRGRRSWLPGRRDGRGGRADGLVAGIDVSDRMLALAKRARRRG